MHSRSTWFAILLVISASTALTIAACSPDATAPPATTDDQNRIATEKKVDQMRKKYGWVGDYHTDGLAYVFLTLQRTGKGRSTKVTKDEMCKVVAKALKEFHKQVRKGEVPFALVDPAIQAETCESDPGGKGVSKNVLVGNPVVRANELSAAASNYLTAVNDAISSATQRSALLARLLDIQYSAVATLPEEEAGAVVATVSIAISSMDYWEANLDAWMNLPGVPPAPYSRAGFESNISLTPQAATLPRMPMPKWWSQPFIRGYIKVLGADAAAGARVFYMTWRLGPIGYDAAAAAALFSSVSMTMSLLF